LSIVIIRKVDERQVRVMTDDVSAKPRHLYYLMNVFKHSTQKII